MAKKKQVKKEEDSVNIEAWRQKVQKDYGNVMFSASDMQNTPRQLLSVGPAIDLELNGGINSGTTLILSGPPKGSKTTTALEIASRAQVKHNTKIFFFDIECRFDFIHLSSVSRLRLNDVTVIKSTRDKILTAQDYLTICENVLKNEENSIIIVDSTSALATSNELDGALTPQYRNENPKLLASWCRRIHPLMPANNNTLILINHMIASQSLYAPPYIEDGGVSIKFLGGTHLRIKSVKKWLDENNKIIGQSSDFQVVFSSNGPPGGMVTSFLRYGHGIDDAYETYQLAISLGVITKSGSWFKYKDISIQGDTNFYKHLQENQNIQIEIYNEVKSLLSEKCV